MSKPVVTFGRFVGWGEHPYTGELNVALAGVERHPVLGDENIVYTSRVLKVRHGDDARPYWIETKNTVYVLRGAE